MFKLDAYLEKLLILSKFPGDIRQQVQKMSKQVGILAMVEITKEISETKIQSIEEKLRETSDPEKIISVFKTFIPEDKLKSYLQKGLKEVVETYIKYVAPELPESEEKQLQAFLQSTPR